MSIEVTQAKRFQPRGQNRDYALIFGTARGKHIRFARLIQVTEKTSKDLAVKPIYSNVVASDEGPVYQCVFAFPLDEIDGSLPFRVQGVTTLGADHGKPSPEFLVPERCVDLFAAPTIDHPPANHTITGAEKNNFSAWGAHEAAIFNVTLGALVCGNITDDLTIPLWTANFGKLVGMGARVLRVRDVNSAQRSVNVTLG